MEAAPVPAAPVAAVAISAAECVICAKSTKNYPRLGCGHVHCPACIRANFRVTMRSHPFRPVQCCGRIDVSVLRWVAGLSTTMGPTMDMNSYRQRLTEFDTPEKLCQCFSELSSSTFLDLWCLGSSEDSFCSRSRDKTTSCLGE